MTFQEAVEAIRQNALALLSRADSNIKLLAVGTKDRSPLSGANEFCVTAYVPQKMTQRELRSLSVPQFAAAMANTVGNEAAGDMVLDVVECGSDFAPRQGLSVPVAQRGMFGGQPPALDAQKFFTTLRCGIGITNPTGEYPNSLSVGTLGFFLRDDQNRVYLVSNSHVIGRSGAGAAGEVVVQPGTLDLTTLELQQMNTLAKLRNQLQIANVTAVVPFQFQTPNNTPNNLVDASLAQLRDPGRGRGDIDRLTYGGVIRAVAAPYRVNNAGALVGSTRVYKVGRTTGFTEGNVVGLVGTGLLTYPTGKAFFTNQIVVEGTGDNGGLFSDRGDSGSGVLNDQHELVGLLFAGSDQQTLINSIADVLRELRAAAGIASLNVVTG